jgi:hypothetical protein
VLLCISEGRNEDVNNVFRVIVTTAFIVFAVMDESCTCFMHVVNVMPHGGAVCEIVQEATEWVCVRFRSGDRGCWQKLLTATFGPIYSTV